LKAVTCDQAGNISAVTTATYTYDNTPPNAPSVTSGSPTSSSSTVTWSWTSGGGGGSGNYRYKLDSTDLTTGATLISATSVTLSSLADGARTLYVQERDAAGNWSTSGSYSVTVLTGGGLTVDIPGRRANGTWVYIPWTGGTSPYTARLYSDSGCTTEIRSLVGTTATDVIFGGLSILTNYYHRIFDSASGATACTLLYSGNFTTADVVASVTGGSFNSISLSFSETVYGNHSMFRVWKFSGTSCGGAGTQYSTVPAVSDAGVETVTGLTSQTGYSFRIFADFMLAGPFSDCINGTTMVSNVDELYPFDTHVVLKVKPTDGPMRVVASNGANCTGMSIYNSGADAIAVSEYARVPALSASTTYYIKVTDNVGYGTCHTVTTTAATGNAITLSNTPTGTPGEITLNWTAGGGGNYLLLRFLEGTTNPCEGRGAQVVSVPSATGGSDLVPAYSIREYMVLGLAGGSSYVQYSNCKQVTAN
jgi:hypothetical protein